MKWVFWLSAALVGYTYLGYPAWLWLRSRLRPRPVRAAPAEPALSILLAVRNEAENLPRKLENIAALDYPSERLEVVAVSDGSTDGTAQWLEARAREQRPFPLRAIVLPEHRGKAVALNQAIAAARGEILVFMDARQRIAPDALRRLAACFADPEVGAASGELILEGEAGGSGVGLYWTLEKAIRQWESRSGSVVGATGALYAMRRELARPLPPETILDDVLLPMQAVRAGRRVVFEPGARAFDPWQTSAGQEFRRKVRTLTGNYQLLQLAPWLLSGQNPLRFEFVSHKLLRLLAPFALVALLAGSLLAEGWLYRAAAAGQLVFYGVALLAALPRLGLLGRLARAAWAFLVLNAAAVVALVYFLGRRKEVWVR